MTELKGALKQVEATVSARDKSLKQAEDRIDAPNEDAAALQKELHVKQSAYRTLLKQSNWPRQLGGHHTMNSSPVMIPEVLLLNLQLCGMDEDEDF